ncbi:MAG: cytidylyltransferase domain-containing protein [Planctomycetota bacterium]|jgi:spore coat polysaccharide biosynthesis protein SpsF
MDIGIIVQARLGSTRLPGKVLRALRDRPMLAWTLDRLAACRSVDGLVVATTNLPADQPIVGFCASRDPAVRCHRGPENDVAARCAGVLDRTGWDAFVRVCGDSPFIDPGLVDRAVACFLGGRFDVVTNVHPRTYPAGQSVEVVSAAAFEDMRTRLRNDADREHVTRFLYRHADRYRIHTLRRREDRSDVRLVVDTPADLEAMQCIADAMTEPQWAYGLNEILELREQVVPLAAR